MLNPSRHRVLVVSLVAFAGLVLGLATDVGLLGWSVAALLALYLAVAGIAHVVRARFTPRGTQT
jgi:membrane-bound metal-dependent hydrolase YbcI (DUF457 family)